jgi:hypothetical protein
METHDQILCEHYGRMLGLTAGLKVQGWSQAPPAKPEACELEPLKAAIVVR